MAVIPYTRVVNVSLTRNDAFPSRRGFGTQLIITTESVASKVDTTKRTKVYASIEEVAADWASSTSAYKAALSAFSQNPRPSQIKIVEVTLIPTWQTVRSEPLDSRAHIRGRAPAAG